MFKITPQYLTDYVNFCYGDSTWYYNPDEPLSMHKIQAEGASKVWNLLLDKNISLLADEVGMGKTIQALAVMATLWRQKPNAKVLLYAPNENVAKKWINEYENFIRYHYRLQDDLIKSTINSTPLRNAVYCENHVELMEFISLKWASFFVCKTSSLSGFMSPKITQNVIDKLGLRITKNVNENSTDEAQAKWMNNFAKKCNERIYEVFDSGDEPPFDLIIFDEAHYLRRSEGYSNRSVVAHSFFSGRDIRGVTPWSDFSPIAKMNLLLTATPNHSSSHDINNIISLFRPEYKRSSPEEILKLLCVRRYRRLAGKTKHEYRDEIPDPVCLSTLQEKLFFAAYQKSLVKYYSVKNKNDKKKHSNPYRILFGYLEGFEFLPDKHHLPKKKKNDKSKRESNNGDFEEKDDAVVIRELSAKFRQSYSQAPKHPKYEKIIDDLSPVNQSDTGLEKKIVYVRRIPSVYEITSRLIDAYDNEFYSLFNGILKPKHVKKIKSLNLRAVFSQLAQRDKDNNELKNISITGQSGNKTVEELDEGIPNSRVFDLFTIKKEGKYRTTDCSNFRNRFLKREQIFSIFFEPPINYVDGKYTLNKILQYNGKRLYKYSIQRLRQSHLKNFHVKLTLELSNDFEEAETISMEKMSFDTLIGIWHRTNYSSFYLKELCDRAKTEYKKFNVLEKEGFSKYLEKGVLFASPHIVYFYSYFKRVLKNTDLRGETLYSEFCKAVKENLEKSGLAKLIADSILSFEILYKKELALTEDSLINEKWTFLNNTIPVYPFCGNTKRLSIIHAFNTPFYPNALIATSVLQEGVDLHYHCSEVIHYGIAWTQGDNEQRVGRVDRMFGKLENKLKTNPSTTLPIHFPYLKNSIDEDQIGRFIIRKHEAEKLLDLCKNVETNNEINYRERIDESIWHSYFNKPILNKQNKIKEPYPVVSDDFKNIICANNVYSKGSSLKKLLYPIFNTLKSEFHNQFVHFYSKSGSGDSNIICALKHVRKNGRNQPILFELNYFEEGLSYINKPTYVLNIKTPMYKKGEYYDDLRCFGLLKKTYMSNPILKICYDNSAKGPFKQYVASQLPLFFIDSGDLNLSENEIITLVHILITFADDLEKTICQSDMKNESIIKDGKNNWNIDGIKMSKDRKFKDLKNGWFKNRTGNCYYKSRTLKKSDLFDTYKYNHENLFVRRIPDIKSSFLEVGLYAHDALPEEMIFLESILSSRPE